jgi:hypothetical protein
MASLYQSWTAPPAIGAQPYESQVMQNTQASLAPQYQQAQRNLDQNLSNRGVYNSGVAANETGQLSKEYLQQLGQTAGSAAMQSAQLAEQNRQRQQFMGEQQQMLTQQLAQQQDQFNSNYNLQKDQEWANMLQGLGKAAGGMMGGM